MASPDLDTGSVGLRLGIVFALAAANGFFVAAEFALVAARRSKIDQMVLMGDRRAKVVQGALAELDRYISGTQLGITLASLALGWIGEPALAVLIDRGFTAMGISVPAAGAHSVAAITIAFTLITFLHIVVGELAPKSVALLHPEAVSKVVAAPLILFSKIASPAIWVLNGAAGMLLRLVGIRPPSHDTHALSPEELRLLVNQSHAHGKIDASDSAMLSGVFDFHLKRARDVMRPRTKIVAIWVDDSLEEVWRVIREERYSRYPVYGESLDDILGIFVAKDLMLHDGPEPFDLRANIREPIYVPDNRAAERVLDDVRRTRAHMAIVLDEFGGTSGIITLEDLVEEVIGEINDEHDAPAGESIQVDGVLELAGTLSLVDVRSDYKLPIPPGSWNTLGGYVFARLGRVPAIGDRVPFPGGQLEVVARDGRRVAAVRVYREMGG